MIQMRWLLQRGDSPDDEPTLLTLEDPDDDERDVPAGLASLPSGALSITVRSATEARETLAELQRAQQELLTAKARATGEGVASLGASVKRRVQHAGSSAGNAARGFRPSAPVNRVRNTSSAVFDGLDAALLLAQTAGGIDDALRLVGSALEAVGDVVSAIDIGDLGDLNF
jgi:hypothetical protein